MSSLADGGGPDDSIAVVPGCQGTEMATTIETFDATLPTWADVYGASGVALANGGLELSPETNQVAPLYSGIIETSGSDHRGQRILVEVPQMLPARSGVQSIFRVRSNTAEDFIQMYVEDSQLRAEARTGGPSVGVTVTYDPVAHRWWQLREIGGMVELEASTDGLAWILIYSAATPAFYASGDIEIAAGYYQAQPLPLGTVRFDNLFVCE
jgi:hypothetical protein